MFYHAHELWSVSRDHFRISIICYVNSHIENFNASRKIKSSACGFIASKNNFNQTVKNENVWIIKIVNTFGNGLSIML